MGGVEWLWQLLLNKLGYQLAPLILGIAGFIGYSALRLVWRYVRRVWCFFWSRARALGAVRRERSKDGPREGRGLWVTSPITPPDNYESNLGKPTVLVIANHKGGVGKTTLAANIGAFWAQAWSKRVLLIDLDSQGTLSAMALRGGDWLPPKGQDSLATRSISGDLEPSIFVSCAKQVPQEPRLKIITAYYDLAQADNRLVIEWLLQCKPARTRSFFRLVRDVLLGNVFKLNDVRYNLADLLQAPAVRRAFDVVIIDCPPRLTTGAIQGLCAGSHLLIPTVLDMASAEAVVTFVGEIEGLKKAGVCPHLKYVGIVGTMTSANVNQIAETNSKALITNALAAIQRPTGLLADPEFVRQSTALINNADEGIAYLVVGNAKRQQDAKDAIGRLAEYVARQCGLPPPPAHEMVQNGGTKP
jgi:cellulose biosynthesis protein BcsQ